MRSKVTRYLVAYALVVFGAALMQSVSPVPITERIAPFVGSPQFWLVVALNVAYSAWSERSHLKRRDWRRFVFQTFVLSILVFPIILLAVVAGYYLAEAV